MTPRPYRVRWRKLMPEPGPWHEHDRFETQPEAERAAFDLERSMPYSAGVQIEIARVEEMA